MAKQTIGLGTIANDDTGDTPRVAGDKINDNFTELYAAVPPSGASGALLRTFTSTEADADANDWGHSYGAGPFDSSDGSPVTYYDHVYVMGINVAGSNAAIDSAKAYLALHFESKFTNGVIANVGTEFHIHSAGPGNAATANRAFTMFMPYSAALRGVSSLGTYVDIVTHGDWLGATQIQHNLQSKFSDYYNSFVLRSNTNNVGFVQQINAAANAYLSYPYYNASDNYLIASSVYQQGAVTQGQVFYSQMTGTPADNAVHFAIVGATIATGNQVAISASSAIPIGSYKQTILNTSSTSTAHAYNEIATNGTGNMYTQWWSSALGGFTGGFNGSSDRFEIATYHEFSTNPYLTITRASNVPADSLFKIFGKLNTPTATPASASATGVVGTWAWDASFVYVCTATDTWKRVAIATW